MGLTSMVLDFHIVPDSTASYILYSVHGLKKSFYDIEDICIWVCTKMWHHHHQLDKHHGHLFMYGHKYTTTVWHSNCPVSHV
ncbi:hypothetical protein E2C01_060345 [Portunus trituberculatus]|uniref:Uncharacterized protein n=1 Tax=Portunus trituberculatus TaxID=210409 RepID=A0A5B7H8M1_PORTR|nr:hypothetical protein [Portunus trituberculatus]